jgi:AraC-like DNA-binding protein
MHPAGPQTEAPRTTDYRTTPHARVERPITECRSSGTLSMSRVYTDAVNAQIAGQHQRYARPSTPDESRPESRVLRRHFSVSHEHPNLQGPAWRDYLARSVDVPLSRTQIANGFLGEIDTYVLDGLAYLDTRTDPLIQVRSPEKISRDAVRDFVFHIAVDGLIETVTGTVKPRKSLQFVPGILALDLGQAMRMERPARSRVLAFFIPRGLVEARIRDAESIHGTVLAYASPLARLVREQVSALMDALPTMNDDDAARLIRQCAELVMAAFAKQSRLEHGARAIARSVMVDTIKRHIDANLHSETLSPDHVLRCFNISRPTLYRMFEPDGGLQAYIRHSRLREAALELVRFPKMAITEIAYGLGFNSPSDFTRAFRRVYGMPPQEFRFESIWTARNT